MFFLVVCLPWLVLFSGTTSAAPPEAFEVVEKIRASPANVPGQIEAALKEGPHALEQLVQGFHARGERDRDGRYLSQLFINWFAYAGPEDDKPAHHRRVQGILEAWQAAIPESSFAKLAAANFWLDHAWDARGGTWASEVKPEQWGGFRERLAIARGHLDGCADLRKSDPAWGFVALPLMRGENSDRADFEAVAQEFIIHFPECELVINSMIRQLSPRWGGRRGEWEPWLRNKLKRHPAEVRASAYTRTLIQVTGSWAETEEEQQEMLAPVQIDLALLEDGFKILYKQYPDSLWVINGEALVSAFVFKDRKRTADAIRRTEGRIDMRVWQTDPLYQSVANWALGDYSN